MMTLIALRLLVMQDSVSSKSKSEASIVTTTKDGSFFSTNSFVLLKIKTISVMCSLRR